MKKALSLLLTLTLAAGLLCGCAKPVEPQPVQPSAALDSPESAAPEAPASTPETPDFDPAQVNPPLWKVTDAQGHTLYLFGTIHVGDGRNPVVLDKVAPVLENCDALAVEFDLVAYEQDPSAMMADIQGFIYTDGTTVKDHMNEELYDRCAELLRQIGAYSPMLDYYNLGMWSQLVEQAALMCYSKLDPAFAMDSLLINRAYEKSIPVLSIESPNFQYELLNSFPDELNLLSIESTLDGLENYGEELNELYEAWLSGDADRLLGILNSEDEDENFTEEQLAMLEDFNRAMLDDRNIGMAEAAKGYLASGDTVFLAVGAAHMLDEMGLVQLLAEAGCTVERIDY